jgi:hypothetical protein
MLFIFQAVALHACLALIAIVTVPGVLEGVPAGNAIGVVASVLFYVAIPVATQFPHLFFFDPALSAYRAPTDPVLGRVAFAVRTLLFWLFVVCSLAAQIVYGSSEAAWGKALARWDLLVVLVVVFSATDYAAPSYARYLRLKASKNWGPRARVLLRDR